MRYFITYGDDRFKKSKKRICTEAKNMGFDHIKAFGPNDLSLDFIQKTKPYIHQPRGGGYWIWKPYILQKTFETMSYGDICLYADAGCELNIHGIKRFEEYILLASQNDGFLIFSMPGLQEKNYTAEKIFTHFNIDDKSDIRSNDQILATTILLIKTKQTEEIVQKFFFEASMHPVLFSDKNNTSKEESFADHRHDQSMFSVLVKMKGIKSIPNETYSMDWSTLKFSPILAKRLRDKSLKYYLEKVQKKLGLKK